MSISVFKTFMLVLVGLFSINSFANDITVATCEAVGENTWPISFNNDNGNWVHVRAQVTITQEDPSNFFNDGVLGLNQFLNLKITTDSRGSETIPQDGLRSVGLNVRPGGFLKSRIDRIALQSDAGSAGLLILKNYHAKSQHFNAELTT